MQGSHIKRFMKRKEKKNGMTLHKYQTTIFEHIEDEQTLLQEDFHVKPFLSQGNVEGLKIQEEHSSFILQGRLKKSRSEEHTSELQSRFDLVCRLLLEKKNK